MVDENDPKDLKLMWFAQKHGREAAERREKQAGDLLLKLGVPKGVPMELYPGATVYNLTDRIRYYAREKAKEIDRLQDEIKSLEESLRIALEARDADEEAAEREKARSLAETRAQFHWPGRLDPRR